MNEFFFDSTLGTLLANVLLLLAVIVAWGATKRSDSTSPTSELVTPRVAEEAPEPDTSPCAVERKEIARLEAEVKRLKEGKQEIVTTENVGNLLESLEGLNQNLLRGINAELRKSEPSHDAIVNEIRKFAYYCERCGYQRPEEDFLFDLLIQTKA